MRVSARSAYQSLNSSYNNLESKQETTTNELNYIRNLTYIFIATTIIFIAATVCCGLVYITFADGTAHMIDCFNTTDKGLFFIEPQNDEIVTLGVGQAYQPTGYQSFGTFNYYDVIW